MNDLVPICGHCGSQFVNHGAYEATFGYGGITTGCQNCNSGIKSDRERRIAALLALEEAVAEAGTRHLRMVDGA